MLMYVAIDVNGNWCKYISVKTLLTSEIWLIKQTVFYKSLNSRPEYHTATSIV